MSSEIKSTIESEIECESKIKIIIDTREPALKALLQTYHQSTKQEQQSAISLKIEPLDVGDVKIEHGPHSILFERKTCGDLASSVKDGRYRDQKMRLLANGMLPRHVVYILEGVPTQHSLLSSDFPVHGLKPSVLSGIIVYTMLRDGIHVVPVQNTQDTAAWIWTVAIKCITNPDKIFGNIDKEQGGGESQGDIHSSYLQNVKVKKMDNVTPENCYLMQLCQIPGVSITTATEISKKHPTMYKLLYVLSNLADHESRVKLLTEIPMIGKKKSQVIVSYLLPEEQKTA